ncbi:MAG: hypothetical protein JSV05_08680 [Candidatus Bathyarchaeota archaeon]|nr:MAG: hypothetical protein JSV05_08680 [Candidatus Bathyarchaeota archaeon]
MRKKIYYVTQIKKAAHLLLFKRHRKPGVKGWELKKELGSDYSKILTLLNKYLEKLGLQIKTVFEGEKSPEKPTRAQLDKARFFVTLRGELTTKETKMMGWRIDDIAGLAITLSAIIAEKGKASRKDVEQLLRNKLPHWRVSTNLDRYIREGYIDQDESGFLFTDWRTRAEIDEKTLIDLILSK